MSENSKLLSTCLSLPLIPFIEAHQDSQVYPTRRRYDEASYMPSLNESRNWVAQNLLNKSNPET